MKTRTPTQQTLRRLLLFLLITFVPAFAVQLLYVFFIGLTTSSEWYAPMVSVCMLLPAFAHFVTRVGSGESLHHTLFFLSLRRGWPCLLTAFFCPVLSVLLTAVCVVTWFLPQGDPAGLPAVFSAPDFWLSFGKIFLLSVLNISFALGEEYGWRGYMMPKLEQFMPFPAAVAAGGALWGLWHGLLIGCGHNFGQDYPGYPWTGVGLMMLFCTVLGFFFTMLTKRSGSVIPAALAHILINNLNGVLLPKMLSASLPEGLRYSMNFSASLLTLSITSGVSLAAGFWLLLAPGAKKTPPPTGEKGSDPC